jgi:hypothetical protein
MYLRLCALSIMSLEALPVQMFRLMRLFLLGHFTWILLESDNALDAMLTGFAAQGLTPTKARKYDSRGAACMQHCNAVLISYIS